MALSPSIPTSFVPKQPVTPGKHSSTGANLLLIVSLVVVGISIVMAVGVFLYANYLDGVETKEGAQLVQAQNSASESTVSEFVRLRDRITATQTVLNQHVVLSQFFTVLEKITLQHVSYNALNILVANDRSAAISITGSAANFNALAAESAAFAGEKDIKSAIFSGISVDKGTGNIVFTIDATLAPSLITESAASAAAANSIAPTAQPTAPVATTPVSLPTVSSVPATATTSAVTTAGTSTKAP